MDSSTSINNPAVIVANKRIAWLDNVKMVAMLWVMFGHTWRLIHCEFPSHLGLFILSFNMALFVIMTGYTSVNSMRRIVDINSLFSYLIKITRQILFPVAIFQLTFNWLLIPDLSITKVLFSIAKILFVLAIAYIFLKSKDNANMKRIFDIVSVVVAFYAFRGNYWFFNMIWCVCASVAIGRLFVAWTKIKNELGGLFLLIILSILVSTAMSLINDKTSDFLPFFFVGFLARFLNNRNASIIVVLKKKYVALTVAVICLIVGLYLMDSAGAEVMSFWDFHFLDSIMGLTMHLFLLRILVSTLICGFFILLVYACSRNYDHFSFWGSQTFALYLIHGFIVGLCFYRFNVVFELNEWQYLLYAIPATLFLLFSSILIIKLFYQFSITRALFLGKFD